MAPDNSIIYIKTGEYDEIVRIGKTKTYLTLVGDGRDATILTGSLNAKDGIKTYDSATLGTKISSFHILHYHGNLGLPYLCRI